MIFHYTTDDPAAPESMRFAAVLVLPVQITGKVSFTPIWWASGATPGEAEAKLQDFIPKPRALRKPKAAPAAEEDVI